MNILSIGSDRLLFDPHSDSARRIRAYGAHVESLHIIVFSRKSLSHVKTELAPNIIVYPTDSFNKFFYIVDALWIGWKIKSWFKEKTVLATSQDPFESGVAAFLLSFFLRIPLHIQVHIDFFSPYYWKESVLQFLHRLIGPFILKRASRIRVVSSKIALYLTRSLHIPKTKIDVLPIYTDPALYARSVSKKEFPQFSFTILMLCRLVKQKNIPLALSALASLIKEYPKVGLVIVGDGPLKVKIKSLVNHLSLQENVRIEPWTNEQISFYKGADVFLLSSNYEGWGRTAVESVLSGTPVVMTDVGCAGEFIKHEENGLVVPVNDEVLLVKALKRLIADKALYAKLKEHIHLQNQEKTSWYDDYNKAIALSWEKTLRIIR